MLGVCNVHSGWLLAFVQIVGWKPSLVGWRQLLLVFVAGDEQPHVWSRCTVPRHCISLLRLQLRGPCSKIFV